MIKKYGIQSNGKEIDSPYKTDFKFLHEIGYQYLDFQEFIMSNSHLYKISEEEFKTYLINIKNEANKNGLAYSQVHALWGMMPGENMSNYDYLFAYQRAIIGTHLLGAPYLVIHPISPTDWSQPYNISGMKETTKEMINKLLPLCEKYNVKIAVENLPFNDEFFSPIGTYNFVKEINSPYVVMCIDTGHFNIFHKLNVYETMMNIKDKVKVFHIHDNNSRTDSHNFPFMGNFDWIGFTKALKDMNFDGVLSYETVPPKSLQNTDIYLSLHKDLFSILKYLDSLIG